MNTVKVLISLTICISCNADNWEPSKELNQEQHEVIQASLLDKKLGLVLAGISGAETQFGLLHQDEDEYCGPHQVAVRNVKAYTPQLQFLTASDICKGLKGNPLVSVMYAKKVLKYFLRKYKGNIDKALQGYSGYPLGSSGGLRYVDRVEKSKQRVLKYLKGS